MKCDYIFTAGLLMATFPLKLDESSKTAFTSFLPFCLPAIITETVMSDPNLNFHIVVFILHLSSPMTFSWKHVACCVLTVLTRAAGAELSSFPVSKHISKLPPPSQSSSSCSQSRVGTLVTLKHKKSFPTALHPISCWCGNCTCTDSELQCKK